MLPPAQVRDVFTERQGQRASEYDGSRVVSELCHLYRSTDRSSVALFLLLMPDAATPGSKVNQG